MPPDAHSTSTRHHADPEYSPGIDARRGWALAAVAGLVVGLISPREWDIALRLLAGWDTALLVALAAPWRIILTSNVNRTRLRARAADPGNIGILVVAVATSLMSLAGAVLVLARPGAAIGPRLAAVEITLVILAVVLGWTIMQTAFSLHYARLYFAGEGPEGGLHFPGDEPDELDFAYFAFGIGVAFQTADVNVESRTMRRIVLVQSVLSFFYSSAVLALMINILAGRV
ncbi:MAG: DUF1345 domain-containing protein [Thermomicrobiales bacterium]|nr:DUF1345 domain-containing protein [Thermomicrobiales bacterium]